jgi:hypothetical protein
MSKELDKATQQFRAGQSKKAAGTLWEVTFAGADGESEARELLALATQMRDATEGGVRADCEEHIARAERFLDAGGDPDQRAGAQGMQRRLREDAVRSARQAHAAGLGWFELRRSEDIVAAEVLAAHTADPAGAATPPAGTIDAVEAEGWRLEHVTSMFRPTKVQTSPLRGAELFMGGDLIDGDEIHIYLFRRV